MRMTYRQFFLITMWALCASSFASPTVMNYQAKLTNSSGQPITAASNVTFTFWDAVSGGNQLGSGFFDLDVVTPDSRGIVSTLIGDDPGVGIPASVFASDSVWLNVNVNGADIVPRERISSVGYAINAFPLYGQAHITPEVTSNASANGLNLLAAVARAKTLTPQGQPLSAVNRAVVLVAPGNYDLVTTQVVLDTEFVDLVGVSTARDNQHIFGTSNGAGMGVLRQTANDVRIENLLIECTRTTGGITLTASDPAAYFPDSAKSATVVRNCEFRADGTHAFSTRNVTEYKGTYKDCKAGNYAFGGIGGIASGAFTDCNGGNYSFGGYGGTASGSFTNCTGATYAFGGQSGMANGKFVNCSGGLYAFGGFNGVASGAFISCIGGGDAFGGHGGTASGDFTNCTGDDETFGGVSGTASGNFANCKGGTDSFAGDGTASGVFNCCTGGDLSFGADFGIASGTFTNCTGGEGAFGSLDAIASGTFVNCTGGDLSFGGDGGSVVGARFYHCTGGASSFTTSGTATLIYCVRNNAPYP